MCYLNISLQRLLSLLPIGECGFNDFFDTFRLHCTISLLAIIFLFITQLINQTLRSETYHGLEVYLFLFSTHKFKLKLIFCIKYKNAYEYELLLLAQSLILIIIHSRIIIHRIAILISIGMCVCVYDTSKKSDISFYSLFTKQKFFIFMCAYRYRHI